MQRTETRTAFGASPVKAAIGMLVAATLLTACVTGPQYTPANSSPQPGEHGGMGHASDGGSAPEGMVETADPTYPVGTEVTLTAAHMEGMDGASATIASSTEDTVYVVDIDADGMTMTNHMWVVESKIRRAS